MNLTQRTSQGERTPPAPVRAYDPFRGTGALYSIAYHGISHAHDAREGARGMALLCPGSRP